MYYLSLKKQLAYESKDYDIDIYTDRSQRWIYIETYFIKDHKYIGANLPLKLLEALLPAKMVGYLKEK